MHVHIHILACRPHFGLVSPNNVVFNFITRYACRHSPPSKILAQLQVPEANLRFIGFQLPFKLTYIANGFGAVGPLTLPEITVARAPTDRYSICTRVVLLEFDKVVGTGFLSNRCRRATFPVHSSTTITSISFEGSHTVLSVFPPVQNSGYSCYCIPCRVLRH
ncbi:hypothetical protein P692DRAFT_20465109 [Suillus brevipes Sb2]|nr:hypothetical protein P692DRAFT_201479932 [Suillus brevipes Sb2]KAG2738332.1 hypothetical protein P692DRAFT_20465109 [Suillus brevipes Sb2]